MRRRLINLFLIVVFLVGLGISLYPTISDQFNLYRASLLISNYRQEVAVMAPEDYSAMFEQCDAYNDGLVGGVIPDVFSVHSDTASEEYMALLNPVGNGLMGTIDIPCIGVRLPIYHTVFDDVLQQGVGHLEGSSLPVGGPSTHCVFAGHRGLPSSRLFTDLDKVDVGDVFYLNILNRRLIYQVDQILIVEPTETEHLAIMEGEDYVTLVTCTPYGINTQRLLVRGTRVFPDEISEPLQLMRDANTLSFWWIVLLVGLPVFLMCIAVYALLRRRE